MNQETEKFYKVKMTVEVERTVLATSEDDAREKVDTSDMEYEIKNYRLDGEISIEEVKGRVPDEYDRINDIGKQIVKNSYDPMHLLKEKYDEIRKINRALEQAGKPTHEPYVFDRMTDEFLNRLRS
jgi:phosphopantetheine adenylyltransferase